MILGSPKISPAESFQPTQLISEHRFFLLLEKVLRRPLSPSDQKWFNGCTCVEEFMERLTSSEVFRALSLIENPITLHRLGEFYACLRADMRWEPRAGFDIWGALELQDMIKAGKVEVKTGGPGRNHSWTVQITGKKLELRADVLIFLGMKDSFNPSRGILLTIPATALGGEVSKQRKNLKPGKLPEIAVNKNRYNSCTHELNRWYEFELANHSLLRQQIAKFVHGDFSLLPQQLSLFGP